MPHFTQRLMDMRPAPIKNLPIPGANRKFYQLYGSASWEADIWGKLKSTKRAAMAALLQSDAYKKAVQTQLVSDIATDYYALLAYDAQLQVTLKTVENRIQDVMTMKLLKESDVVTGAAVVQSEANRYSVEVTIPDLRQNIRETENALSILTWPKPGWHYQGTASIISRFGWTYKQGIPAQLIGQPARCAGSRISVTLLF
jgi:multidrug efflux system outer membrane protein